MELQAFCTGFPLFTGEKGIKIRLLKMNSFRQELQENKLSMNDIN